MPRGGARSNSGPKKKEKIALPLLKKSMAAKLRADESTELRWKSLRDAGGPTPSIAAMRIRFDVERYLWDREEGRPVQQERLGNQKEETFKTTVDVTSARDKLTAMLLG